MLQSFRECNCFSFMLSSRKSLNQKTLQLPVDPNKQNFDLLANEQISQRKKLVDIDKIKQMNDSKNFEIQNRAQLQNSRLKLQKMNLKHQQMKTEKINISMIQKEDQNSCSLQESDIGTQKSQIIINDINADLQLLENNYLFSNQKTQNLWDVYQRVKTIQDMKTYSIYLVKNKINGQLAIAKIFVNFQIYSKELKNYSKHQLLQKYTVQIYQKAKNQIKCLIKMTKANCRNICRIIDYELKPPSYIGNQQIFDQGFSAIVYQYVSNSLLNVLQQKKLTKLQKKKIIYQLVCALTDIHQCGITICNFWLENIQLDSFDNVKLCLTQITQKIIPQKIIKYSQKDFHRSSPQILMKSEQISNKIDMWTAGMIIVKILLQKQLICQNTPQKQLSMIKSLFYNESSQKGLLCTKLLGLSFNELNLIQSLLKFEPNQREEFKQLIEHKYFQNLMKDSTQYQVQYDK